jgi:hypothetical protein
MRDALFIHRLLCGAISAVTEFMVSLADHSTLDALVMQCDRA